MFFAARCLLDYSISIKEKRAEYSVLRGRAARRWQTQVKKKESNKREAVLERININRLYNKIKNELRLRDRVPWLAISLIEEIM